MKINQFFNVLLYFYVKKLRLVLNSKITAHTVPANRLQLKSKKKITVKTYESIKSNW